MPNLKRFGIFIFPNCRSVTNGSVFYFTGKDSGKYLGPDTFPLTGSTGQVTTEKTLEAKIFMPFLFSA